jgi:hypothetical protein
MGRLEMEVTAESKESKEEFIIHAVHGAHALPSQWSWLGRQRTFTAHVETGGAQSSALCGWRRLPIVFTRGEPGLNLLIKQDGIRKLHCLGQMQAEESTQALNLIPHGLPMRRRRGHVKLMTHDVLLEPAHEALFVRSEGLIHPD